MKPNPATTAVRLVAYVSGRRPFAGLRIRALAMPWLVLVAVTGAAPGDQPGARPADTLLRLVPPDAAVVVTVEGLRDKIRGFSSSRLAADLQQLPAVKAWFDSEKYRQFEKSRAQIEALVGANLTEIRDELIGDAVVLALRLPAEAPTDSSQARGLLLFQARDHALLERLIDVVNTAQKEGGELARVADRQRAGTTYHVREFPDAAARLPEWYVAYADGTFAFSNSESLIQGVIDQKSQSQAAELGPSTAGPKSDGGLVNLPRFKEVQQRLPATALARLFVDPRAIERLMAASPPPTKPTDANILALIARYAASVRYAGAALVWGDKSIVVHTVETLDPSKVDPWLARWAGDTRTTDPAQRRLPPSAVAVAAGHVDLVAVYNVISQIVPEEDQPKLTNLDTVLTGVLMGQDLRTRVLPRLGPGIYAYLDSPPAAEEGRSGGSPAATDSSWPFPLVVVVPVAEDSPAGVSHREPGVREPAPVAVADALENALHTTLALTAMDEKRNQGRSRITTWVVAGASVTTLHPAIPFAYAVDRAGSRLILSTSARSVARYLEMAQEPKPSDRFRRLQAAAFPGDRTFFCVDLDLVCRLAARHRDRLVQALSARKNRPKGDVDGDLTQVLALARLFEAAFVTSGIDRQASTVQRSMGLILHDANAAATGRP